MAHTRIDHLNYWKRREGYNVNRPRRPFLRRCHPFGELVEDAVPAPAAPAPASYRGLWTPGPWMVEWEPLPDGRVAYWIDDPVERYQPEQAMRYTANTRLMEHALEYHRQGDMLIDMLHYFSQTAPAAEQRAGYERLMEAAIDLRDRADGALTEEEER